MHWCLLNFYCLASHKMSGRMHLFSFVCCLLVMYYMYSNKGKSFIYHPHSVRDVYKIHKYFLSIIMYCLDIFLQSGLWLPHRKSLITNQYCHSVAQVCVQQDTRRLAVNVLFRHVFLETVVEVLPKLKACWGTSTVVKAPYGPISLHFPFPLALPLSRFLP